MDTLTRPEVVVIALHLLGGAIEPQDTEDIAVRAAEIAPGMFSWKKPEYVDRIDKELVRVALSDARLKKGWVVGKHKAGGWLLTQEGVSFAGSRSADLQEGRQIKVGARSDRARDRERSRLLASEALDLWRQGGMSSVSDDQADAFFRIDVYVQGEAREKRILRVENQFGDDEELGQAVRAFADRARERKA